MEKIKHLFYLVTNVSVHTVYDLKKSTLDKLNIFNDSQFSLC
jgi:DNA-binding CsgD family transcriptional regulator